mgnify:FL=1
MVDNTKEVTMDKIDDMINDRAYTGVIWNTDDNVLYKWTEIQTALVKMGLSPAQIGEISLLLDEGIVE